MSNLHEAFRITSEELAGVHATYIPQEVTEQSTDFGPDPAATSQLETGADQTLTAAVIADQVGVVTESITVEPAEDASSPLHTSDESRQPDKVSWRKRRTTRVAVSLALATAGMLTAGNEGEGDGEGFGNDDRETEAETPRLTEFGEEITDQVERVASGEDPQWDKFEWHYTDQHAFSSPGQIERARDETKDAMLNEGHDLSGKDKATLFCWYAIVAAATKDAGLIDAGVANWHNETYLLNPGLELYAEGKWADARIKCSWSTDNRANGYHTDMSLKEDSPLMQLVRQTHPDGSGGYVHTTGLAPED